MELASHSIMVIAPRERVWHSLLDWQSWPTWDIAMQSIHFDGPIDVGSQGKLKIKDGPQVLLHVDSINEGESYTDHFKLLGTKYIFKHAITNAGQGAIRIDFAIEAEGPTAFIFGNISRSKMKDFLPQAMENLKTLLSAHN